MSRYRRNVIVMITNYVEQIKIRQIKYYSYDLDREIVVKQFYKTIKSYGLGTIKNLPPEIPEL
jgi:hypothetical protein